MREKLKPPIILIGNVRSGTTLVQNLIGLHPDVTAWYEPRTLWLYADPGRRHDEFDERDATRKVIRYIRRRFLKYQSRHGGRQIMEKTPANILKVPYVNAVFPEAILLHITRNPFSYISSSELKWQRTTRMRGIRRRLTTTPLTQLPYLEKKVWDLIRIKVLRKKYVSMWGPRYKGIEQDVRELSLFRVIARQWGRCNKKAREDLAVLDKDRTLSFRYEDLIKDPETHLRRICDHCGLQITDNMLRATSEIVSSSSQDKWCRLDPDVLRALLPEIQEEMDFCGYEVPPSLRLRRHGRDHSLNDLHEVPQHIPGTRPWDPNICSRRRA